MSENILHYKDFSAFIGYSAEDEEFFGNVIGIEPHGVHFGGKSVKELKKHMQEAVDGYLEACEEQGIEPKKPFNGRITFRTTPERHARLAKAAMLSGKRSVNALIDEAVAAYTAKILEGRVNS